MAENLFRETIQSAVNGLRELADCETVIGTPIVVAGGTTIIPVSKVSVGFVGGGLDYHSRHAKTAPTSEGQNSSCGGGTGVTVTPIGFLVTKESGAVEFLPVAAVTPSNMIDSAAMLLEKTPEIARQFKAVFAKKEKSSEENA